MLLKKISSKLDFSVQEKELRDIKKQVNLFVRKLKKKVEKENVQIFVGGSFAKNTLVRGEKYDIDVFVRFKDTGDYSLRLEKLLKEFKPKKVHGSRNYFQIKNKENLIFEVVPVKYVKSPENSENVTDLSYFHVKYINSKLKRNKNLAKEIVLAKKFCKSIGVYGAETYIGGFSGYAIECLIVHFKSFKKMLKKMKDLKCGAIIDPEKNYKKKSDIYVEMNESKLKAPIILVDPTWKKRNALAALKLESFEIFKKEAKKFLKKPSEKYFIISKEKIINDFEKSENSIFFRSYTVKNEGDVAATKLKKYFYNLINEMKKAYEIKKVSFYYRGDNSSDQIITFGAKKFLKKTGPDLLMKKSVEKFKEKNENYYISNGRLFAEVINKSLSPKDYFFKFINEKNNIKKMRDMYIEKIEIL